MRAALPSLKQKLCLHVLDTLPDSTNERAELLEAIVQVLPAGDPVRSKSFLMLELMHAFDEHQRNLPFGEKGNGK